MTCLFVFSGLPAPAVAQTAQISEEIRTLETYPFSDPNPVPILTRDPRLYPYHSFEGYSATSEPHEWRVVKLENDLIEVFVLPEVGGKVWGAVVKETGHEFIYRNEVMKFRNIALRGPWTSGGIEFNFGVIGHTPATATPVDYVTVENADGSVSCWVGGMDLPSRTHWRVEIRLSPGRAYFETNVLWYNPTPLEQPYYNWMTAAAFAQDDLEMSIPGNAYLQHSGNEMAWPVDDQGRFLPVYDNNRFEGHKSYHVVGELNDFFGGYYHDEDYGFGHWSRYEDMPGQKLWLWALSREGGVWEDLLTDTDGQYVEFQAGRLFVQYSPGPEANPITQASFDPMSASRWSETWFPLESTGGLMDASRDGAMHVSQDGDQLIVAVNTFRAFDDTLRVWSGERLVAAERLALRPLEPYKATFRIGADLDYRVQLRALDLDYQSDASGRTLSRPFQTDPGAFSSLSDVDRDVFQARELVKGRRYADARTLFESALTVEPWHRLALLGMADLEYRAAEYAVALEYANRALQLDAYDAEANFLAGNLYRALGQVADARDAFGWAARSVGYRAAAYAQLAELRIAQEDFDEAARYARLSIDYDRHGVPGWRALAVVGRQTGDEALAEQAISELLALDPLHHFARAEAYLGRPSSSAATEFLSSLGGEYPDQSLIELAIGYAKLGLSFDARTLLDLGGGVGGTDGAMGGADDPLVHRAWRAWLAQDADLLAGSLDLSFAFPYRAETLAVMEWSAEHSESWGWDYLLALNLWALGRSTEAADRLVALGSEPDFAPAYVARADLLADLRGVDRTADLERAIALNADDRLLRIHLVRHLLDTGRAAEAATVVADARVRFPADFNLALVQAEALIHTGRPTEAAEILASTHVLPSENARQSHRLWEQAHTLAALDAMDAGDFRQAKGHLEAALEWPESLGQGRPYEPEERLARLLLGRTEAQLGNEGAAKAAFDAVIAATSDIGHLADMDDLNQREGSAWRLDLLALTALTSSGRDAELQPVPWAAESPADIGSVVGSRLGSSFDDLDGEMILRALRLE